MMTPVDKRLLELKADGLTFTEVTRTLIEENFKTIHGKKLSESWAQSRLFFLKKKQEVAANANVSSLFPPTPPPTKKKKPALMNITPIETPPSKAKIMALVGDSDEITKVLKGFFNEVA